MCVLSFVPFSDGSVAITHNRDEHFSRPVAISPKSYWTGDKALVYPKDPVGGGTWFLQSHNLVACLLNGGFENHVRKPKYARSRGLVLIEYAEASNFDAFLTNFDPTGMEPFTAVFFDLSANSIRQLVWDEVQLHSSEIDASVPKVWSSFTLYDEAIQAERRALFANFLQNGHTAKDIWRFHTRVQSESLGETFRVSNKRPIFTVATTQVSGKSDRPALQYLSFL